MASAEEKFGIDEYSDVIMLTKPVIYISVKEICSTHSVSLFFDDDLVQGWNQALHGVLSVCKNTLTDTLNLWIFAWEDSCTLGLLF